ncbi:MAG: RNA degradosome polyphosphate kinase, partial [Cellvibrionaceae bacterium]|nr:RNA degradosome polyphosphate kinase [Cellvibrionaceae bacterium]
FLEHTRAYYFANANPQVYCASADLMERNLNRRVETCFPVAKPTLAKRVINELRGYIEAAPGRWELDAEGNYQQPPAATSEQKPQQLLLLEQLAGYSEVP